MAGASRVISDHLNSSGPPPVPSKAPARTASSEFESSFLDNALPTGREQEPLDPPDAESGFTSGTTRLRAIEELRTLLRAMQAGVSDPFQLTDLIFYARHPDLIGVPLTRDQQPLLDEWNAISALLVHPMLSEVGQAPGAIIVDDEVNGTDNSRSAFAGASQSYSTRWANSGGNTNRFDPVIRRAVEWCPGLSPTILKNLLAQESNFNTAVINQYGYAGIAQFGRTAAREVGLQVGIAGSEMDERLNPLKAIPAAARLLNLKAQRLGELAFSRYGQPEGVEFWKFVLGAYNGGEGTIALAMGQAYRSGLSRARADGLVGYEAISFARSYAMRWENLRAGGEGSPLALAAARYFPDLALSKYYEIANYPTAIVARSLRAPTLR